MRAKENTEEIEQIQASLKTTSYLDKVFDKIVTGKPIPKNMVPDFSSGNSQSTSNESSSLFSMDGESMFRTAAGSMTGEKMTSAIDDAWPSGDTPYVTKLASSSQKQPADKTKSIVTASQWRAIQKFPALIEFLGSEDGEKIAQAVLHKVNEILAIRIGENSNSINKCAYACKAEKNNIKQYFMGSNEDWVCVVIASGPFRGDETIYFDPENDNACILRQEGDDFTDVTSGFNVVHEFANKETIECDS